MIFSNENAKIGGDRMTSDFMKELLSKDEKITVEYKTCQYGIQEDVYETVCSFSNRYGGYIIMGVEDDGTPIGINPNMVKDMKKNFVNQLNNPDKMSPTLYLSKMLANFLNSNSNWLYSSSDLLIMNLSLKFVGKFSKLIPRLFCGSNNSLCK